MKTNTTTPPPAPASPRPWSVGSYRNQVVDANDEEICETHEDADAALIVEAVNASDSIDAETIIRLRAENATLNEAAANLQRSRSAIIADNNILREALREIQRIAADATFPARKGIARVRSAALAQIHRLAAIAT